MAIRRGKDRQQAVLFPMALDIMISEDNVVRVIDLFVDKVSDRLPSFGFGSKSKSNFGASRYENGALLKLYLYGYLNRIRSSRQLERACQINIEMRWLMGELTPNYHTIANFRKDNSEGLEMFFKLWNKFLEDQDCFGKKTLAVDSAKYRGQNAKKRNFDKEKVEKRLKQIDAKTKAYLDELEQMDEEDTGTKELDIKKALADLKERKEDYMEMSRQLEEGEEEGLLQVSLTDGDARSLTTHKSIAEVGYNTQMAVDSKHSLIVAFEVTNKTDHHALHRMAQKAKDWFHLKKEERIDVLSDKGYTIGSELKKCHQDNIITYSAPLDNSPNEDFAKANFLYDALKDVYMCPNHKELSARKDEQGQPVIGIAKKGAKHLEETKYTIYASQASDCKTCPFKNQCIKSKKNIREIKRTEFDLYVEANKKRTQDNKTYYRLRQQIVEHPTGTIKRSWGYTYTLLKGIKKVTGEFSLIFVVYNLRRSLSIFNTNELIKRIKDWKIDEKWLEKALLLIIWTLGAVAPSIKGQDREIKLRIFGSLDILWSTRIKSNQGKLNYFTA